ncbi:hypothetical protein [Desulfatitalea tepidiphila]|uniref:hypothetical protein n=1 Tax=Desulfatitalea tepidiphila TaxID=1185843 RepID=UPI0006B59104|nr:hypothetical protein [Desulfatitalea tepidiphila]
MKLIDLKALSDQTSISIGSLRQYLKLGLPHYRVRRKILVNTEEFQAWLQQFKSSTQTDYDNLDEIFEDVDFGCA